MATYQTKYGPIYYDQSGNDSRPNIRDFTPMFPARHAAVKFQKPALEAFQAVELLYGRWFAKQRGWVWKKRSRAIPVSGSWRSFDYQYDLWRSDSSRFASPYTSGHVQAVAFDLNTENPDFGKQRDLFRAMGWKQARADEIWHFSFGVAV